MTSQFDRPRMMVFQGWFTFVRSLRDDLETIFHGRNQLWSIFFYAAADHIGHSNYTHSLSRKVHTENISIAHFLRRFISGQRSKCCIHCIKYARIYGNGLRSQWSMFNEIRARFLVMVIGHSVPRTEAVFPSPLQHRPIYRSINRIFARWTI